ncbi:hypothetical protein COHA_009202 [Chlorella ohadii]|uniref:YeeE/YedE family protein n=1 Tax=Chlorella ohadii TaxID=2649997 RepID=A0AAD5DIH7_9CHLO|nr:hypothetical protein COHA_009202 [Chlorella ohadii]
MSTCSMAAAPFLFTPVESGLGGLTLGLLAFAKLQITGRILGISGAVNGLLKGFTEAWRVAFVVGLLAGGLLLRTLLPTAFEMFPEAYSLPRAALAGLLVGLGTARGSGCTSGHGICGNARLSLRSFVATCSFMFSGAVTAWLADTAGVFGLPGGLAPLAASLPLTPTARFGAGLLAAAVVTTSVLALAARRLTAPARASSAVVKEELSEASQVERTPLTGTPPAALPDAQKLAALSTAADLFIGLLFALGLGVSGMLKPSKVAGFLSVIAGTFDPSLMCVMGGALLLALPAFQWALRHVRSGGHPLANVCYELPSKTAVDGNLVWGALLFGAGWGLGGICPGPGLVALASLQPKAFLFIAAMLLGQRLDHTVDKVVCATK